MKKQSLTLGLLSLAMLASCHPASSSSSSTSSSVKTIPNITTIYVYEPTITEDMWSEISAGFKADSKLHYSMPQSDYVEAAQEGTEYSSIAVHRNKYYRKALDANGFKIGELEFGKSLTSGELVRSRLSLQNKIVQEAVTQTNSEAGAEETIQWNDFYLNNYFTAFTSSYFTYNKEESESEENKGKYNVFKFDQNFFENGMDDEEVANARLSLGYQLVNFHLPFGFFNDATSSLSLKDITLKTDGNHIISLDFTMDINIEVENQAEGSEGDDGDTEKVTETIGSIDIHDGFKDYGVAAYGPEPLKTAPAKTDANTAKLQAAFDKLGNKKYTENLNFELTNQGKSVGSFAFTAVWDDRNLKKTWTSGEERKVSRVLLSEDYTKGQDVVALNGGYYYNGLEKPSYLPTLGFSADLFTSDDGKTFTLDPDYTVLINASDFSLNSDFPYLGYASISGLQFTLNNDGSLGFKASGFLAQLGVTLDLSGSYSDFGAALGEDYSVAKNDSSAVKMTDEITYADAKTKTNITTYLGNLDLLNVFPTLGKYFSTTYAAYDKDEYNNQAVLLEIPLYYSDFQSLVLSGFYGMTSEAINTAKTTYNNNVSSVIAAFKSGLTKAGFTVTDGSELGSMTATKTADGKTYQVVTGIAADKNGEQYFLVQIQYGTLYTVTLDYGYKDDKGEEATDSDRLYEGVLFRPGDPQREGYAFAGWYTDADFKTAYDAKSGIKADTTLYAKWEAKDDVTVTFNFNTDVLASREVKVKYDGLATAPEETTYTDADGNVYELVGWYLDSTLKTKVDLTTERFKADTTLYAKWKLKTAAGSGSGTGTTVGD